MSGLFYPFVRKDLGEFLLQNLALLSLFIPQLSKGVGRQVLLTCGITNDAELLHHGFT